MNQGKLEIVKDQMDKTNIDLLGINELNWTGQRHFKSNKHWICYSGHETYRKNGLSFILNNMLWKTVLKYSAIRDRVTYIRLQGTLINVTLIQVYALTTDAEDEDVELFYEPLQNAIDQAKNQDLWIIMGDFKQNKDVHS